MDLWEFETSLVYRVSFRPAWAMEEDPVSKEIAKKEREQLRRMHIDLVTFLPSKYGPSPTCLASQEIKYIQDRMAWAIQ